MSSKLFAPWDSITVARLNAYQDAGRMHPYTCPREHFTPGEAKLIATADGWRCCRRPACGYSQNWAHVMSTLEDDMNTNYAGATGKRIRFPFSGNVYRVRSVNCTEETLTFSRDDDPEDEDTETFADLRSVDVEVLG